MITPNSKISDILAINDKLLDILIEHLHGFSFLKIRFFRSLMAPWLTLSLAARIGNANLTQLIQELNNKIGFSEEYQNKFKLNKIKGTWGNWENTTYKILDVRPILEEGGEPFSEIINTVDNLDEGEGMALIAPFEPAPLYLVLDDRGWSYRIKKIGLDFFILFRKVGEAKTSVNEKDKVKKDFKVEVIDNVHHIDVRSLEPPEPMARVLSLISTLQEDTTVRSKHDRKPVFLLDKLDQLGYSFSIDEKSDEEIELTIHITKTS